MGQSNVPKEVKKAGKINKEHETNTKTQWDGKFKPKCINNYMKCK